MMNKERLVIALEDFEAFNPHYDLEKPIKVKKGSVLLVNGGFPCQQLTTMSDNGETLQCSLTEAGFNNIYKICRANNIDIIDFRTIANMNALKAEYLKPGAVKYPIFYWFEDCEVLPMNLLITPEGKEYKVVETIDIFGKPCMMRVEIKESDYCVLDENQRLIMIFGNYFEKLINTTQNLVETLKSSYLKDVQNANRKFTDDLIKEIEKLSNDEINEILSLVFGGE